MNTTLRRDDSDLDDAIRKSLGDIIASGQPGRGTSERAADLTTGDSGRRWLASAAAVVLVIAGLGLIASRNVDVPAPADQSSLTAPTSPPPESATGMLDGTASPRSSGPRDLTQVPIVDAAPVVLPGQLMEISPQDEFLVITAWRDRLNDCLADEGQPGYTAELDSLDDIVAYRNARNAKVAGDYDIDLPARNGVGVLSSDPTVRACADVAERSITTSSGWSLYAPPQESVDAQMEVNDRVYERLADARTEWSNCMTTDFGYEGADMAASPSVWSTTVDLADPDEAAAVDVADESCLETIGYYETQLQLTIEETRRWADDNTAILDRLATEAETVLKTISSE